MQKSSLDIYVRAYAKPKSSTDRESVEHESKPVKYERPSRVLVFDTETTNDSRQTLKFGYFEIWDHGQIDFCGLFYNENTIKEQELQTLQQYCSQFNIPLLTRKQFNEQIFYPEVFFKQTACVGFNLPFDISRIAIDSGYARTKSMLGGFSFKLSSNMEFPRVLVKHVNNTMSFVKFGRSIIRYTSDFNGNFIDLRTLGWAIRSEKYSLETACKEFNTEFQKARARQYGKITPELIQYCINDVKATYSLFQAMVSEYEKYQIDLPLSRAYSPASIGKALLHKMRVSSDRTVQIPDSILGYVMSAYYGGRSEVRIRKAPVPVVYMDFLSTYPTVCTLMDLWKFVTCDHIEHVDWTQETIDLVDGITLQALQNKNIWKQLAIIAEVEPEGDILPVRAKYDSKNHNIAINYLNGNGRRLWYTIHDIIVSKLLTGKTPKITKAIRFVPVGIQTDLKLAEFLGKEIDPSKNDFFKALIEHRKRLQERQSHAVTGSPEWNELQSNQYIAKIIANATSYGIFIELNESSEDSELEVFGLDNFTTYKTSMEKPGSMFNPIMGALITGACRLMLGMAEAFVYNQHGGYIAFCDTDSLGVNPRLARPLQEFFKPLNPYDFNGDILKIESDNYKLTSNAQPKYSIDSLENPLLFFGVSSKRYVLYRKSGSRVEIIKNTEHGLGSFVAPHENQTRDWIRDFWHNALTDYYNGNLSRNVLYSQAPAVSKQVITTKTFFERLERFNIGKDYDNRIKPFNFFHVGVNAGPDGNEPIIPMMAYSNNIKNVTTRPFVDYKSGRKYQGSQYWKTLDQVYSGYFNHKETKFNGSIGHLSRKLVSIKEIVHIGKETITLELSQILGIGNNVQDIQEYYPHKGSFERLRKRSKLRKLIDTQFNAISNWITGLNNVNLTSYGITKKTLYRTKRSIKLGYVQKLSKKTKLKFINCNQNLHKSWTMSNPKQVGKPISDNIVGQKEVIICQQ